MSYQNQPLGKLFASLTKQYIGILANKLADLPIERYYYPLVVISQNSGKIGQHQLAEMLGIDKVTVFRIVEYLEKNEMIERLTNPEDRRCQLLQSTKEAEKIVPRIEQTIAEIDQLFVSKIDPSLRDGFEHTLEDMIRHVSEEPTNRIDFHFNKITDTNENV